MRRRDDVTAALDEAGDFVGAQAVYARMRADGTRIGLATVYRTLQTLAAAGELDAVRSADGEMLYRRCSAGHHHHLTCRVCRRTVEVDSDAVERWARNIAAANGFREVDHVVEVFGVCGACAGD